MISPFLKFLRNNPVFNISGIFRLRQPEQIHKNIRICHITRDVNPEYSIWFGGVPSWIKSVCYELEKRNFRNFYIAPKAKIAKNQAKIQIHLFKSGKSRILTRISSFFFTLRTLRKIKADIIHLYPLSTLTDLEIFLLKKIFKITIIATCLSDVRTSRILNLYYKIIRTTFLDKIIRQMQCDSTGKGICL